MPSESPRPPLILASTSPYRRELLLRLGLPFRCAAPSVDEDAFKRRPMEPTELAERLARAKAGRVLEDEPDAVVIGGDQLVAFEGRVLGKPGTSERAAGQLLAMSGRAHQLITAIAVADRGGVEAHVEVATLTMRALGPEEIGRYVASDLPLDCAGSYRIESRGIVLFDRIVATDHSAIVGLPLMALTSMLRARGFPLP